jgi:hypothetical protein
MPKQTRETSVEPPSLNWLPELRDLVANKAKSTILMNFALMVADMMSTINEGHEEYISITRNRSSGKPIIKIMLDGEPLYAEGWSLEELASSLGTLLLAPQ